MHQLCLQEFLKLIHFSSLKHCDNDYYLSNFILLFACIEVYMVILRCIKWVMASFFHLLFGVMRKKDLRIY